MIKTLRISFALKNTYRVNGILYSLKQIPLLKKILPGSLYKVRAFKIFANILSVIWEIMTAFLGRILYFLLMFIGAMQLYEIPAESRGQLFLHIFVFLTIIGSYSNTFMFNPTKDKYYALIIMRMNAREYTLVNYFYTIIKAFIGFGVTGIIFGLLGGLTVWQCLLLPLFAVALKMSVAEYELRLYEKKGIATNENRLGKAAWIGMLVLMLASYGLPAIGVILPVTVSISVMCLSVVAGVFSVKKILNFREYRSLYQQILTETMRQMDAIVPVQIQVQQKNISGDKSIVSNKKGFEYLNELFIKRHRKILWKSAKKIAMVALTLIVGALLAFCIKPELKEKANELLMTFLPYFVFIMYVINRGTGFTSSLFINCDHSLLTYSFYKQPKFILKLFWIRLREIVKINLLPAVVIGSGLAILLLASGGTDNPLNYVVLFVSIICLSIFFSVHYLTWYYLLQPYNAGTELKSGTYQVVMTVTYIVCYAMLQFELPTLLFGAMTIIFCVLYCIVAGILVYFLAPKTFKIRN